MRADTRREPGFCRKIADRLGARYEQIVIMPLWKSEEK